MIKRVRENSYQQNLQRIVELFNDMEIEYMVVGGGALVLHGFDYHTNDVDFYFEDSKENNSKIINALIQLGFELTEQRRDEILRGKDFIQFNKPFELDLMFYPDGFDNYEQAKRYKEHIGNIPVMNVQGIIKSKKAANRPKDKLILPMLEEFQIYLLNPVGLKENILDDYFKIVEGYEYTDIQTMERWMINRTNTIEQRIRKGIG